MGFSVRSVFMTNSILLYLRRRNTMKFLKISLNIWRFVRRSQLNLGFLTPEVSAEWLKMWLKFGRIASQTTKIFSLKKNLIWSPSQQIKRWSVIYLIQFMHLWLSRTAKKQKNTTNKMYKLSKQLFFHPQSVIIFHSLSFWHFSSIYCQIE